MVATEVNTESKIFYFDEKYEKLLDWSRIYNEIVAFKESKGYWNLKFDLEKLKSILLSDCISIKALPGTLEVKEYNDIKRLEEIAIMGIKKYLDLYYRRFAKRFESKNMTYQELYGQMRLFAFEQSDKYVYKVQINKEKKDLIKKIKNLANDVKKLITEENEGLPRVNFEKHLFLPILLRNKNIEKVTPQELNEGEIKFLQDLRDYLKSNKSKFERYDIFILRNFPKIGVGFFNLSGFYPDFIMWIISDQKQKIVFIDPHGLEHNKELDNEKITLHKDIKSLEKSLGNNNIELESFIVAPGSYDKIIEGRTSPPSEQEYNDHHVLFMESKKPWVELLFEKLGL